MYDIYTKNLNNYKISIGKIISLLIKYTRNAEKVKKKEADIDE